MTAPSARSLPKVPRVESAPTTSLRPTQSGFEWAMTVATATGRGAAMASATALSRGNVVPETGSMKTSMTPPQVSPTENASSSDTPYRTSLEVPSCTTSLAASYTAPSTQPPDTEPLTEPSGATTIDAPGGRGADWNVRTTVPTPAVPPASQTSSRSARTSRISARLQGADQAGGVPRPLVPLAVDEERRR